MKKNKLLKKAFIRAYKSKISKYFFGSIGLINVILLSGKNYFGITLSKSLILGVIISISLFLLIYFFFLILLILKLFLTSYKEDVYGEAILYLMNAFSKIHLIRKQENIDDEEFKNSMAYFCEQLRILYDKKTKSKCAVSIKLFRKIPKYEDVYNTSLFNFVRDKKSLYRDTDTYKKENHSVFNNTCYTTIFTKILSGKPIKKIYYFNNNLPEARKNGNYENSSWEIHKMNNDKDEWKLPYYSEIVVPIIPLENKNQDKYKILGFICVDSNKINCFTEKYDTAILLGVADGIYDIIFKKLFN